MSDGTPRCSKCGSDGCVVGRYQYFTCGWSLDENGKELTPCNFYDEPKGGPEESMTPPSEHLNKR